MRTAAAVFALALLATVARALPDPETEPEWKGSRSYGYCAGLAYRNVVLAPAIEDSPRFNPETNRSAAGAVRVERKRALMAHQLLQRIQSGVSQSVAATNECSREWAFRPCSKAPKRVSSA